MATFTNADAVLNGTVLELIGTVDPDLIDITGDFVVGGALTGLIDGAGGFDVLGLYADADLTATLIANIEATTIYSDTPVTIDAAQIGNLGTITLGGDAATAGVAEIILGNVDTVTAVFDVQLVAQILEVTSDGVAGETLSVDFSGGVFDDDAYIVFNGSSATETITGGSGGDVIRAGRGSDTVFAGDGDDIVNADQGHDVVFGGDGNDRLWGNGGNDEVHGGTGDDVVGGGWGDDELWGDEGDDTLIGHNGSDVLRGGDGNDILEGGVGADELIGGSGQDEANYTRSSAAVTISLIDGTASGGHAEGDVLSEIEHLSGSQFNDTLTGDREANSIWGNDGDDIISGGSGRDRLFGGEGNDTISGGRHHDTLYGDAGDDTLSGDNGDDRLYGGDGNDTLTGGSHSDRFIFADGDDTDIITDFTDGTDLIGFIGPDIDFASLTITSAGADAIIEYGSGDQIIVQNAAGLLDASDFVFNLA